MSTPPQDARPSAGRLAVLGGAAIVTGAGCAGPACPEADDAGLRGSDGTTFCELVDVVEGSEMSGTDQGLLLDCLAEEEDKSGREELLAAFQEATDDDLESLLLSRLLECQTYADYWEDQDDVH